MLKWAVVILALVAIPAHAITIEKTSVQTSAKIPVLIVMPDDGRESVPAMILLHGSGGMNLDHKMIYAREFAKMGIATIIIDSFSARGIKNTVTDQYAISAVEMAKDAIGVLHAVAESPKINARKIGLMGFSKGGTATIQAAYTFMNKPGNAQFALYIAMYPSCNNFRLNPKTTEKPIKLILAKDDKYTNPNTCLELENSLKTGGADIESAVVPDAKHGWDVPGPTRWSNSRGENYSGCRFVEVEPRIWVESHSGIRVADEKGPTPERKKAFARCVTHGVSGGHNAAASAQSMALIKDYVAKALQ